MISYSVVRTEKLEDLHAACWYCVIAGWSQIMIIFFMKIKHILWPKVEHGKRRNRTKPMTAMLEKNANDQNDLKTCTDLQSSAPDIIHRITFESEAEDIDA